MTIKLSEGVRGEVLAFVHGQWVPVRPPDVLECSPVKLAITV